MEKPVKSPPKGQLSQAHFAAPEAARAYLEELLWPSGPVCPRCGETARVSLMGGKSTRPGLYKCYACRKPFTVTVGTIFESAHIPLHLWLQAVFLLCNSKKGISSNQLSRALQVTLKTAWFMSHRIRWMMSTGSAANVLPPMGGAGAVIEADETYFGKRKDAEVKAGSGHKMAIVSLVERGAGVRSFHVPRATKQHVLGILRDNIHRESRLHTDESQLYARIGPWVASEHQTVNHGMGEYARGDVTTNNAEAYFSVFKRGMRGVYQHCSESHLHRYLSEFDFRYNTREALGVGDLVRTEKALKRAPGKRLTYRQTKRELSGSGEGNRNDSGRV